MKYITFIIFAIGACSFSQIKAQQKNEPTPLKISGSTSLYSSEPLVIIVDDQTKRQITQNNFEGIDQRDIQSISVLKDYKALEAYGERGRNGVVIIVMKGDSFSETFPGNTQPVKEK